MNTQTQEPPKQTNGVVKSSGNSIVDSTLIRINELQQAGGLQLPKEYSAGNALRTAYLILQEKPALLACTKESIANALLKMVVQGLNPFKHQCSFIAYGNQLVCQREYQGSIAVAKRYGLKSVVANAIFEGEEFAFEVDIETGRKKITKHASTFESYGGKVKGAYAIIEMADGSKNVEIMNMNQIQSAWNQGATKGQSPAHKNFADQMACKTVINRAVKTIINSSDDADLFDDEMITQTDTPVTASVKQEINNNANGEEIGFDDMDEKEELKIHILNL
jgi:recombination protein RecT